MIGLTSLEVYNSIFISRQENNKFKHYADLVDDFAFTVLKDELEEILDNSKISPANIRDERLGRRNIEEYKKLESEKC